MSGVFPVYKIRIGTEVLEGTYDFKKDAEEAFWRELEARSPLADPELKKRLHELIRAHVEAGKEAAWDRYFYAQACQDAWGDPIEALGPEDQKKMEDWFEKLGEHPSPDVVRIFNEEERRVFGKTVEDEL